MFFICLLLIHLGAVDRALKSLKSSMVPIPDRFPTETILIESVSKEEGKRPLVSFIHGGPHATSLTAFSPSTVAMALQGCMYTYLVCSISLINRDYEQTHYPFPTTRVHWALARPMCASWSANAGPWMSRMSWVRSITWSSLASQSKAPVSSSHGEEVTEGSWEHMVRCTVCAACGTLNYVGCPPVIGQYPEVFSAAVLRNPVISCAQPAETDIPDWYFWEFGLPFTAQSEVTPELYKKLYPTSPIAYVDKVKAPVLLLIGKDDRRVAPAQGKSYYHALKGRGNPVDMLEFPGEGHPLEGVEAARISWEAAADWFAKAAK